MESSSGSWPHFHKDKSGGILQFDNRCGHQDPGRGAFKQKILEHEAVFKNQVCELHRLYQIQRNMMEEPALASCLGGPQLPLQLAKWEATGFPVQTLHSGKASGMNAENGNPTVNLLKTSNTESDKEPDEEEEEEPAASDGRALKARRTFDLRLPADDFIGVEKERQRETYNAEDGNKKPQFNHFSASCLRGSFELVDLNEPIQTEKVLLVPSDNFIDLTSEGRKSKILSQPASSHGMSGETTHFSNRILFGSGKLNREHITHAYEGEFFGSMTGSIARNKQTNQSPFLTHLHVGSPIQASSSSGVYSGSHIKVDDRAGQRNGFVSSNGNHDPHHHGHSEAVASNIPTSSPSNGCSQFIPARVVNTVSESRLQIQDRFPRNFLANSTGSTPDLTFQGKPTSRGFFHGSPAFSSKVSRFSSLPARSDILIFKSAAPNHSTNHCPKIPRNKDGKSAAMANDNNKAFPRSPSEGLVILDDLDVSVTKVDPEDHSPGRRSKLTNVNMAASPNKLWYRNEGHGVGHIFSPSGSSAKNAATGVVSDRRMNVNECERSLIASTSLSADHHREGNDTVFRKKSRMIDINVTCEPGEEIAAEELPPENKQHKNGASVRHHIDLNFPVTHCNDPPSPWIKAASPGNNSAIDLEDPDFLQRQGADLPTTPSVESKHDQDAIRDAAEAVLAMSMLCPELPLTEDNCSPSESSLAKALLLFADAIATPENGTGNSPRGKDMDEFEAAALQLEDTKEDCIHKASVVELQNVEEIEANASNSRPRSAKTRRGRPRRRFQRDNLLGLSSLSRHEVSEDLQMFRDFMKIMGHCCSPGLARQKGSRNERGPGWGKMTRRSRRQ